MHFYLDLAYVFAGAIAGGWLARALKQPLIVGYVLAGVAVGPFTPGPRVSEAHVLERLAEIGVVLLMYSIGMEFSAAELRGERWTALAGAPLGILLSIALAMGVGTVLGWAPAQGFVVGAAVSVASTMVLARLLEDRGEQASEAGRAAFSITLVEDLAVVVLALVLPRLGGSAGETAGALASRLAGGLAALTLILAAAAAAGPRLLSAVAKSGDEELSLLMALALGFSTAAAAAALGFSPALGAFAGGLIVRRAGAGAGEATRLRLRPLRDAFVAFFFVTIGTLIDPRVILQSPRLLLLLLALIVVGKFAIWTGILRLFGHTMSVSARAALGLTQIGELSYVLVQVARSSGLIGDEIYNATLAASLLSILLNSALVRRLAGAPAARAPQNLA